MRIFLDSTERKLLWTGLVAGVLSVVLMTWSTGCAEILSVTREVSGPVVQIAVDQVCSAGPFERDAVRRELDHGVSKSRYPATIVRAVCDEADAERVVGEVCGRYPEACGPVVAP